MGMRADLLPGFIGVLGMRRQREVIDRPGELQEQSRRREQYACSRDPGSPPSHRDHRFSILLQKRLFPPLV
jgi:hypothetical protein